MENCSKGLAIGGHDGSFLIVDRVGNADVLVGVRSHTGEVLSVYLIDADIEKLTSSYAGNTTRPIGKSYRLIRLNSPANRMPTQPEHVIASSWRVSVSPPFQSQHPRTSMLGERASVLPSGSRRGLSGSMRQVSVVGPPLLRACDQAQAP